MNVLEPWHLILILVIAVLVFGPKKLRRSAKLLEARYRIQKRNVGSG